MSSHDEVTAQVIARVKRRASYSAGATALAGTQSITAAPLSLDETGVRLLTNSLRNLLKAEKQEGSLRKAEVGSAKNLRGLTQLMIQKIFDKKVSDVEADDLVARAQRA